MMESPKIQHPCTGAAWSREGQLLKFRTPWVTLLGEYLRDDRGNRLEYWRVEKEDSVIVLPIHGDRILLPPPQYRPGLGQSTLDFPGGRIPAGGDRPTVAAQILQRELGVDAGAIATLTPLNAEGWPVNSSFSNQKLFGFVAQLHPEFSLLPDGYGENSFPSTAFGIQQLLGQLTCLQCRAVLLEYVIQAQMVLNPTVSKP